MYETKTHQYGIKMQCSEQDFTFLTVCSKIPSQMEVAVADLINDIVKNVKLLKRDE